MSPVVGFTIFQAEELPFVPRDEFALVGLPDTIWFPEDGLCLLPGDALSFLLFPVAQPEFFDAVLTDTEGHVLEIQVKRPDAASSWVWGAFKMPGTIPYDLFRLWCGRDRQDEYIGTLVNAYLAAGGAAYGIRSGQAYVDVGTLHGYREAIKLLSAGPTERPLRQDGGATGSPAERASGHRERSEQEEAHANVRP